MTIENYKKDEYKFIHDIAGPIGAALFSLDAIIENMRDRTDARREDLDQIVRTYQELQKVNKLLQERRNAISSSGGL